MNNDVTNFFPVHFEDRGDNTFYFKDVAGEGLVVSRDDADFDTLKSRYDAHIESTKSTEGKEEESPVEEAPVNAPVEPETPVVDPELPTEEEARASYESPVEEANTPVDNSVDNENPTADNSSEEAPAEPEVI